MIYLLKLYCDFGKSQSGLFPPYNYNNHVKFHFRDFKTELNLNFIYL